MVKEHAPIYLDMNVNQLQGNLNIVNKSGTTITMDNLLWITPPKVSKRINIMRSGLNNLPTAIVPPELTSLLSTEGLIYLVDTLNKGNENIGLPPTNDIIIRTAVCKPDPLERLVRSLDYSEPALLMQNVGQQNENTTILGTPKQGNTSTSLDTFLGLARHNAYFLFHTDHYQLQKQSLHGRLTQNGSGAEFICANGTLHARDLEITDNATVIRVNSEVVTDMFNMDINKWETAINSNSGKNFLYRPKLKVLSNKCKSTPIQTFRQAMYHAPLILNAYYKSREIFGNGVVMEFRIYPEIKGVSKSQLHVLDIDDKF